MCILLGVVQEVGEIVYDMKQKYYNTGQHPKQFMCCV